MWRLKTFFALVFCFFFPFSSYSAIKIGTLVYDPPFVISAHEGFDIDLSRLLCERMKAQCQLMPMSSKQLYQALQLGKIDMAIAGITISSSRKADYIFSLPYMLSKGQFLTLSDSNINSVHDLQGSTVGVIRDELSGGVFYNYVTHNYQGQFKINQYDTVEDMFAALSNKTISAVFLYRSDVNYWNHNGSNMFKPLGPVVTIGGGLAIMALPKNQDLIGQINKLLQQMEQDNTYLGLYKTYFSNE